MPNFSQYCAPADVKAYGSIDNVDTGDDAYISKIIIAVQNKIDADCNWSFHDETRTNEERFAPDVKIDNDGLLHVRVDKCPVYAVVSVAYRFRPTDAWTAIDSSLVEFFPTPATVPHPRADSNLILCYVNLLARRNDRIRVKLTYSGGFATTDPPGTLNLLATRMTWWKYKQRAASFDKIAMPEVGQVVIPSALPPDLKQDLEKWKRVA